jgi:hypothetical protein
VFDLDDTVASAPPPQRSASPRRWNLELRFGPFRPDEGQCRSLNGAAFASPLSVLHLQRTFGPE